jgi:hypothetical protein
MMTTLKVSFLFLLGVWLTAGAAVAQKSSPSPLRLFINEVQPGTLSALQYCTLVFDDHHFHSEKADIKHGQSSDRKVYEGQLADADWNSLIAIIDGSPFRDMKVPQSVPPPVMQDTHPYTISVARGNDFQNMEFLTSSSMKPYEAEVKPLLQWWKSFRGRRTPESKASPDSRCTLDSNHAVFSQ